MLIMLDSLTMTFCHAITDKLIYDTFIFKMCPINHQIQQTNPYNSKISYTYEKQLRHYFKSKLCLVVKKKNNNNFLFGYFIFSNMFDHQM